MEHGLYTGILIILAAVLFVLLLTFMNRISDAAGRLSLTSGFLTGGSIFIGLVLMAVAASMYDSWGIGFLWGAGLALAGRFGLRFVID